MKKIIFRIFATLFFLLALLFIAAYKADVPFEELKEKYANAESKFMELKGMPVHYRIEGAGHPLVLVHGTSSSLHTWDEWTKLLKDSFKIIRVDLPAFGLTGPNPTGDYSIAFYTQFLNQFLEKIKVDSFHLAGNSLGGRIAWNYAHAFPQKVKKLVLLDASGAPNKRGMPAVFKLARNPATAFLLRHILPESFIKKNLKEVYHDDSKISDALVKRYHQLALRTGNRQAFIDRANINYVDESHKIKTIQSPTLIMWGKQDTWAHVDDAYYFDQALPNSRLKIYENAGHIPMEEIAGETAKDVEVFLREN